MSNPKTESTEIPGPPVKGPFTRTITRTYEVSPIALNIKVTETIDASHDVMIPEAEPECDCKEISIPGSPPGVPFIAVLKDLFQGAAASAAAPAAPGASDGHGPA